MKCFLYGAACKITMLLKEELEKIGYSVELRGWSTQLKQKLEKESNRKIRLFPVAFINNKYLIGYREIKRYIDEKF